VERGTARPTTALELLEWLEGGTVLRSVQYEGIDCDAVLAATDGDAAREKEWLHAKSSIDEAWQARGLLRRQHGVSILDGRSLVATVVQLPVLVGLFSAIRKGLIDGGRFLWVRDISSPDAALAALCGAVTAMAAAASPSLAESQRTILILLPALLTTFFLSKLAAGLSIYALSQALVGLLQSILLRRRAREIFAS
jgi:membrane protein insertase Oxa1/YidC/SpoIIIJ